jgi:hypothetical protein
MFSYPQPETLNNAFPIIRESLPRSKLGYATNNQYSEFPPLMSDGRALIASYQPEAVLNQQMLQQTGIKSNWEYRKYLTENSVNISRQNFREACNDVGYFERVTPSEMGDWKTKSSMNSVPYSYASFLENTKPAGYANSDLKDLYLSREQLQSRKVAPGLSQEQLFSMMKQPGFVAQPATNP